MHLSSVRYAMQFKKWQVVDVWTYRGQGFSHCVSGRVRTRVRWTNPWTVIVVDWTRCAIYGWRRRMLLSWRASRIWPERGHWRERWGNHWLVTVWWNSSVTVTPHGVMSSLKMHWVSNYWPVGWRIWLRQMWWHHWWIIRGIRRSSRSTPIPTSTSICNNTEMTKDIIFRFMITRD